MRIHLLVLAAFLSGIAGFNTLAQDALPASDAAAHTGDRYPTIPMSKALIGEDQPGYRAKHGTVHYFTAEEGEEHRVVIAGGEEIRHSSVLGGAPVAGGRVTELNRDSGHYSPAERFHENVLHELASDGVDASRVRLLARKKKQDQ